MTARVHEIKLKTGCMDCGYNTHPQVLDFDHRDPSRKRLAVSKLVASAGTSWATIEAEIAKCDVVCANCHRVRTAERRKCL